MKKQVFHLISFVLLSFIFTGVAQNSYANNNPVLIKLNSILGKEKPVELTDRYKRPERFLVSGKSTQETEAEATVNVKVISAEGEIITEKVVNLNEFLDKGMKIKELPDNSLFLLFHGDTAYYILP